MSQINNTLKLPNGVTIRNRIVKSAMSEALADEHNNPTQALIDLFAQWGAGGAGILITGNTPVDRMHLEHAGNFVLDANSDMGKVAELAKAGKSGGAAVLCQLSHAGRQTPEIVNPHPTSISDVRLDLPGYGKPAPLTEEQIPAFIQKYVESAKLAQEAGFDGVEIHAAHGYLLSSSLSPRINNRSDRWGGEPLENRARLVLAVVHAVRGAVNKDFILAVKLNSSDFQKGGFDHEDSVKVAVMLEAAGVDFIEISGGNFEEPSAYSHAKKSGSTQIREAYFLDYAAAIKAALSIPLMVTGGFRSASVMNDAIESGKTDLIGIGRPFITDPSFAAKLLSGEIDRAPAIEESFPPADELPRGAVLSWFCTQIARVGKEGSADLEQPVVAGHEQYLAEIDNVTNKWVAARK
ncbi:NADH:flavin oxidoreductase/NADH oxidase family protein (plasmid) [Phaeobacter inhibens]|uniref:NADH:flavin oxidoreductase/NADH oxidase family protein n=1 Tax=Phaeobacter inhibens TaxID=221822 RepID=UPI000163334A|nr:NADH:flavin oxidoreductase/NADH oxidase family protein [Phaeobacter inhibens]AFO93472.1 putative NADH:flavin oxidoreductase / NADH oxidase [Phaeobacter inhibens DSM 17395]AUQ48172.1 putative NADH:flavin oxidoreductase / NADH oxidase [Phaeobacter inhibens]AXT24961.1 NADH:flavin oxidoreductase/NADH oxidase family protein [Phaeobacter inhibens]